MSKRLSTSVHIQKLQAELNQKEEILKQLKAKQQQEIVKQFAKVIDKLKIYELPQVQINELLDSLQCQVKMLT